MTQIYHRSRSLFLLGALALLESACATPERVERHGPEAFQKHQLALTHDTLRSLKELFIKNGVAPTNRLALKIDPDGASCKANCGGGTSQTCDTTECGAVDGAGCWEQGAGGQPVFKLCVTVEPRSQ
jgi:hypothetical protein